jgi:iron complex outermembrane recepter protein
MSRKATQRLAAVGRTERPRSQVQLLTRSALSMSVAAALGAMALSGVAPSASAQDVQSLEEVVITGSRIVRRDYVSNSPIVTINAEDFETQTGLNIESYLNQLPTYNPAFAPTTTQGDVQITPVNSVGIASISLRGFGSNRSLVLINGKRPTPINALMVTDINGIPSALIQRVETITGGASAVYGADAVGGVTNFILRDNFEGLEFDAQHGIHEAGDGEESRVSAVLGANFSDGRGNVTLGVERYERRAALERERDIFTDRWAHPYVPGSFVFLQGVNAFDCAFNCPDPATVDALFGDRPAGTNVFNPASGNVFRQFNFNSDGTIFVGGSEGGLSRYTGPINQEYAVQRTLDGSLPLDQRGEFDNLKWNNVQAYASAPQDRYSFFASGHYDMSDSVRLFARGTLAESKTRTLLFGTNAIGGWEATVPYDPITDSPVDPTLDYRDPAVVQAVLANPAAFANPDFIGTGQPGAGHPVPMELAILLNSRTDNNFFSPTFGEPTPDAAWQPNWNPLYSLPPRNTFNTNTVWQVEAGVEFDLGFRDWMGEAYVSRGESSTYNIAGGNLSLSRYRALINEPDYGRGADLKGNQESIRPGFGSANITCESGFYDTLFHGDVPLSADCFDAINATLQTRTQNQQNIAELNFQGSLADMPAGELRTAVGYQYRENSAQFFPDILQSTASFTDQVIGVYPTGYLDASTSVHDYYVEALVPLVADVPGLRLMELELGARYSDYEHTDSENTWKAMLNWQVTNGFRLRGGFNRATRAPNIGELFLNTQEIFTAGGNFGDACGIRSNAPYGAGGILPDPVLEPGEPEPEIAPGQTAEGALSTLLICQELMGGAGSTGVNQFYNVANATGTGGGGFAWVLQEGNPNLLSETADTWTFGFVATSPFSSPWLSGMTASFDWYKVDIQDAIMLYSLDYAAWRCFGTNTVSTPEEAAAQAATDACQLLPRDQNNGAPLTTSISYDNQASIKTSGFDIGVNWFWDLPELFNARTGGVGLNLQATVLDYYRTRTSPAVFDVETDWKGSLGPNLPGTNAGAFDYRLFSTVSYFRDSWSVNLRWRHLPGVYTAGFASQQAIIANNQRVAAGGEGIILGYTPTTEYKSSSYNVFDLSFNWNVNQTVTLRAGITNLLDETPSAIGRSTGFPVGTDLGSVCGGAAGCQNPTNYSLPGMGTYNGGYYDTLGRRAFLGLKVTF